MRRVLHCSISIPQRCDWKEYTFGVFIKKQSYFNTSKVRLEVAVIIGTKPLELQFQYLKGAIGRPGRRSFKAPLSSAERQFTAWNSGHNIVIRRFRVNPRRVTRWHKVLGGI